MAASTVIQIVRFMVD